MNTYRHTAPATTTTTTTAYQPAKTVMSATNSTPSTPAPSAPCPIEPTFTEPISTEPIPREPSDVIKEDQATEADYQVVCFGTFRAGPGRLKY